MRNAREDGGDYPPPPPGHRVIYPIQIRHWKTGKMIRRKDGKRFRIVIKDDAAPRHDPSNN